MNRLLTILAVSLLPAVSSAQELIKVAPFQDELIKIAPELIPEKMPITKLVAAKLFAPLGAIQYPVSTTSPKCQAYVNQGLNYYYSYVWMEAARSFETAIEYDPDCAFAHYALSKAIEKWGSNRPFNPSMTKAKDLLPKASYREKLLINARLAEKGMIEGVTPENRKKEAIKYLDELLTLHDDDEEGWFARSQVAEGPNAAAPFHKALLRVNPLHAGANHELVHHYENIKRPALGWPHAVKYIESASGLPHAYHMQAHLATRIGKWDKTTDWSWKAIELQRAYHKEYEVPPNDDHQFTHHLEILTISLVHDGRYKEAREIKAISEKANFKHTGPWFRLHLAERDWPLALDAAALMKKDKLTTSYMRALVFLAQGDVARATSEANVLKNAYATTKRGDKDLELRMWEVLGILSCLEGHPDAGLKLLQKTVTKTKDDYSRHSWGHGAYHMERWGIYALRAGKLDVAEEAFLEALAHDAGSVRGALGMQVICERQGRTEEAADFARVADRAWRQADPGVLDRERQAIRELVSPVRVAPVGD